ncbi:MAG: hypothetical protein A2Z21_08940 [Candidatus Fraserbacteria bacterium RBG_16_55_9]|uniref:Winged helix-turn-helix domain-containing protein n=1 Tax=Fraserbacteria sp. (strain RBG_16_55_9) TaxID=1817864 RepID=A0A1F5UX87_FRAXR|nr:MAG: hypothetical protein A2Z21_08940 [Candidatus Fraserbacteria bacterium RBG_16_55_9]
MQLRWTKEEARLYQLYAVGLHGKEYPRGKAGIRGCFRDLDTLQLDPLPVLGRNHDLVIQARVDGTHPGQALDLIHQERLGFEYWDKVLCAVPIEHFPLLRTLMQLGGNSWENRRETQLEKKHPGAIDVVYRAVEEHGPLSSRELGELDIAQDEHRAWKSTRVANGALEVLWNRGRISITHRTSYRRYFDLTERVIPKEHVEAESPSPGKLWHTWLVKRVRNVGLLPLRGDAEAWAFVRKARDKGLVEKLVECDKLALIEVKGIRQPFLAPPEAEEMLEVARDTSPDGRARFIAPLDPLLWCRRALVQLWDFEYAWEVYKPVKQRRWGYYVLPVLYGDRFVARFDGKYDREKRTLHIPAYHEEPNGLPRTHAAIEEAFKRFLNYLGGERIVFKAARKR